MAHGSIGDQANEVFLDARYLMKIGGTSLDGKYIPGLASNVITDRWLHYLIYAMTMDQSEISDLTSIQEKARKMLNPVGQNWADQDKLLRKSILLHISGAREHVLSDQFRDGILDREKILAFIDKNRIGTSTYSKDKARGREKQVGLSGVEIDRIESAARPLLTKINNKQKYEKMKNDFVAFDPSSASPKEVDLHDRFPDYIPFILVKLLDTPEKFKVFEEWHDKIHLKSKD